MNWKKLIDAVIQVESGGRTDGVGDHGLAVGILQAHPNVLIDVNTAYGTNFQPDDRLDPDKARAIFVMYVLHYASVERMGHQPNEASYALCWHYGPSFQKITDRDNYWAKVYKIMNP